MATKNDLLKEIFKNSRFAYCYYEEGVVGDIRGYIHFESDNTIPSNKFFSGDFDYLEVEGTNCEFLDSLKRRIDEYISDYSDDEKTGDYKYQIDMLESLFDKVNRTYNGEVDEEIKKGLMMKIEDIEKAIQDSCGGTDFSLNWCEEESNYFEKGLDIEYQQDNPCGEDLTQKITIEYPKDKIDLFEKLESAFYSLYQDYDIDSEVKFKMEMQGCPPITDLVRNEEYIQDSLDKMRGHYENLACEERAKEERDSDELVNDEYLEEEMGE